MSEISKIPLKNLLKRISKITSKNALQRGVVKKGITVSAETIQGHVNNVPVFFQLM